MTSHFKPIEIAVVPHLEQRPVSDLLILPYWKGQSEIDCPQDLKAMVSGFFATKDFTGDLGETSLLYQGIAERRILLLGLGKQEEITLDKLRLAYYKASLSIQKKRVQDIVIGLPDFDSPDFFSHSFHSNQEALFRVVLEGFYFSRYSFLNYRSKPEKSSEIASVTIIGNLTTDWKSVAQEVMVVMRTLTFIRDMVNQNADEMTPDKFLAYSQEVVKHQGAIKLHILRRSELEKEGMGLFLAVAQGSAYEPYLLHLRYEPCPSVNDRTLCVGKAITFDTGGLHLKAMGSMETMRCDMAGGAVMLGLIQLLADLQVQTNVDVLIPVCENAIGSKAFKPGDIIKSKKGLFIEISSTDAEGRLCLADAITYGIEKLLPHRIIDIATLTGAVEVALGSEITGVLSNSDALVAMLQKASKITHEMVAQLPLYDGYKELLRSDMADMKNSGGRVGGAITAGLFLHEFVDTIPWLHLDIAGSAFFKDARRYYGKGATGIGLRLLLNFFLQLGQSG